MEIKKQLIIYDDKTNTPYLWTLFKDGTKESKQLIDKEAIEFKNLWK